MNKFCAKVKLEEEKSAGPLIKAFFQNFNSESNIEVKEREVKLEVIFEEPPLAIIDVISQYKDFELNYGVRDNNKDEKGSEEPSQAETKKSKSPKAVDLATVDTSKLDELAKNATSFENLVEVLANQLEMNTQQEIFTTIVMVASTEIEKISWKNISTALEIKGMACEDWKRAQISKKISGKLNISLIPFLKKMAQYKKKFKEDFQENTVVEQPLEKEQQGQSTEKQAEVEKATEQPDSKPRVKMACMPEIKDFEETLANLNKEMSIEEMLDYVFNAMGIENLEPEYWKQIRTIAKIAVKIKEIDLYRILAIAGIPTEKELEIQAMFSNFINTFAKRYDGYEKIHVEDFLSDLKKVIMLASEIED